MLIYILSFHSLTSLFILFLLFSFSFHSFHSRFIRFILFSFLNVPLLSSLFLFSLNRRWGPCTKRWIFRFALHLFFRLRHPEHGFLGDDGRRRRSRLHLQLMIRMIRCLTITGSTMPRRGVGAVPIAVGRE